MTLRELCLNLITENRRRFLIKSSSGTNQLENLRKLITIIQYIHIIYYALTKISLILLFGNSTATVLKTDLLLKISSLPNDVNLVEDAGESVFEEIFSILSRLMHKRVGTMKILLNLDITWTPATESKFRKIVEAIGVQECSRLKVLHLRICTGSFRSPYPHIREVLISKAPILAEDSYLAKGFFQTLPRLASLQILQLDYFYCDNWALQQFGMLGNSLV